MKKLILLAAIGCSNFIQAQTITEIDSVSFVLCDYLKSSKIEDDTEKINNLLETQFQPYLAQLSQAKVDQAGEQLFYRLQRNCFDFRQILDRLNPPAGGVISTSEKPKSTASEKDLQDFKKQSKFYYLEVNGDKTHVSMKNGKWTDSFTDKTTSNLTYTWLNETEFELIFIESNNAGRGNFSVAGDAFVYQVLSKEDKYYTLSVNIPGQDNYDVFKMYFK